MRTVVLLAAFLAVQCAFFTVEARGRGRRVRPVFDAQKPVLIDPDLDNAEAETESRREREGKSEFYSDPSRDYLL